MNGHSRAARIQNFAIILVSSRVAVDKENEVINRAAINRVSISLITSAEQILKTMEKKDSKMSYSSGTSILHNTQ